MLYNLVNDLIFVKIKSNNQNDAFIELIDALKKDDIISHKENFLLYILTREDQVTTFMDNNVAIPHAKSKYVNKVGLVIGIAEHQITSIADASKSADVFFMLAVPEEKSDEHMEIISSLANLILNKEFINNLRKCNNKEQAIKLFNSFSSNNKAHSNDDNYDIVAITACPVGIAHTYLAAQSLEKAAIEENLKIKVQTNGSIGIKNAITQSEFDNAKHIIVAADIEVDLSLLRNRKYYKTSTALAINKPLDVIKHAMQIDSSIINKLEPNNTHHKHKTNLYSHLMSGVSYMLPFIVSGGILIAIAIMLSGITPGEGVVITNPFYKQIADLGSLSFFFIIPILAGYIAFSIAGKPALLPGVIGGALASSIGAGFLGGIVVGFFAGYIVKLIVKIPVHKNIQAIVPILIIPVVSITAVALFMYIIGAPIAYVMISLTSFLKDMGVTSLFLYFLLGLMIAFDMGGPINKVAFLFGTSLIASGITEIMGALAVAICVPPLGMALATYLAPKKYTNEEKQAGKASFFMGLIGITEGAIPFAASDPIRVIPSIMLGSGVGAVIAGLFHVKDYAPHGGLIVLPVVENQIMFVVAIIIGSLITATLVNLLKQRKS